MLDIISEIYTFHNLEPGQATGGFRDNIRSYILSVHFR